MENRNQPTPEVNLLSSLSTDQLEDTVDNVFRRQEDTLLLAPLEDNNPALFKFVSDVQPLRKRQHFGNASMRSYVLGNAIMERAIRTNYESRGLSIPRLSPSILETYFQDLMGGETLHFEMDQLKGVSNDFLASHRPLSPRDIVRYASKRLNRQQARALQEIQKVIYETTYDYGYDLLSKEKGLFMAIEHRLPTSSYRGLQRNRPGKQELVFGAVDVYMPFRIYEQVGEIRRMFEAEVR